MRITKQLLMKTVDNVNKHYLKERKLMIVVNSYNPDIPRTLYKVMICEVPSSLYLRSTDYVTVDRAYYYVIGMMNFLDVEEMKQKRSGAKR